MITFKVVLGIARPITADFIGLASKRSAMAGVTGQNRAKISFGICDDQYGQIVIRRAAFGSAIGSETGLALSPGEAAGAAELYEYAVGASRPQSYRGRLRWTWTRKPKPLY